MKNTTTHVSEAKKSKVKELAELLKTKKSIVVVSVKGLPSAQFQDIKKKLRGRAKVQIVKKSLINFALEHAKAKELTDLIPYIDDSTALLFSDEDAFVISGILSSEKSPQKAKVGQIAPHNIEVKAGPTDLIPGPDISALSSIGLAPKVEGGKIAIMKDKVIAKEGAVITSAIASIMAKLGIVPFEVGIDPVAAYMDGKVYANIKIDKEAMILTIQQDFSRSIAFSVELGIVNSETIDLILNKAGVEGNAIDALIDAEKVKVMEAEN